MIRKRNRSQRREKAQTDSKGGDTFEFKVAIGNENL